MPIAVTVAIGHSCIWKRARLTDSSANRVVGYPPLTLFARRAYGPRALNRAGRGCGDGGGAGVSRLDAQQGVPTTWL